MTNPRFFIRDMQIPGVQEIRLPRNSTEFRPVTETLIYPDVPKQKTFGKDCGVFMIKLMETWGPDVDPRSIYSSNDAFNIRIQYANKLYFNPKNQVDQSLVTEFYALG